MEQTQDILALPTFKNMAIAGVRLTCCTGRENEKNKSSSRACLVNRAPLEPKEFQVITTTPPSSSTMKEEQARDGDPTKTKEPASANQDDGGEENRQPSHRCSLVIGPCRG